MLFNLRYSKFVRFVFVGVVNTLIDLGVLNLLVFLFGVTSPLSFSFYKSVSFVCALVNSYFLNKNFTFQFKENNMRTFYSFVLFSLVGFSVNVIFSGLSFSIISTYQIFSDLHVIATVSAIVGTILGFIINYVSYNYLVFK